MALPPVIQGILQRKAAEPEPSELLPRRQRSDSVPEPEPEPLYCKDCPMSAPKVDGLIDTVDGILHRVAERAEGISAKLLQREQSINNHLDGFDAVDSSFAEVDQKLAGFLKGFTNRPPADPKDGA